MASSAVWERKMRNVFHCLDKKKAGRIGHEQLADFALGFQKHGRISETEEQKMRENIMGFWKELNSSGGDVDVDGFISIHKRVVTDEEFGNQAWEKHMKNVALFAFQSFANPNSGTMALPEFKEFWKCLGVENMDEAESTFAEMDKNKQGFLTMDEFVTIWRDFTHDENDTVTKMLFGPLRN